MSILADLPRWARELPLRDAASSRWRYLLVLSHMRSYSSVIAHLLGSAPQVAGCGESHLRYRHRIDLWRLRRAIRHSTGQPAAGPWLLDKVLHNHVRAPDRWIASDDVRALIFLRRPEPTLQSLLALARAAGPEAPYNDPQVCCDYYVSRLHRLRADGQRLGRRAVYFDSEAFIQRPAALLAGIAAWLQVELPVSLEYRLARDTGKVGFGDPSPNIRAGRVLPAGASTVRAPLPLHPQLLAEAEAAYQRCRSTLLERCSALAMSPRTEKDASRPEGGEAGPKGSWALLRR